jgi:hypothetical protein
MTGAYVHGYDPRENLRLQDQASTLVELLHSDTAYPAGSSVLEAGCGMMSEADFDKGIADLHRTAEADGVFCYTFFKAGAVNDSQA